MLSSSCCCQSDCAMAACAKMAKLLLTVTAKSSSPVCTSVMICLHSSIQFDGRPHAIICPPHMAKTVLPAATFQGLSQICNARFCRDITDDGLLELTHLQKLQILVINSLSPSVSGSFLSSLQGDFKGHGHIVTGTTQDTKIWESLLSDHLYALLCDARCIGHNHISQWALLQPLHYGLQSQQPL